MRSQGLQFGGKLPARRQALGRRALVRKRPAGDAKPIAFDAGAAILLATPSAARRVSLAVQDSTASTARGALRAEQVAADPTLGQVAMADKMPASCDHNAMCSTEGTLADHALPDTGRTAQVAADCAARQIGGQLAAERAFLQTAVAVGEAGAPAF